mgnify:CR=1 FL=1
MENNTNIDSEELKNEQPVQNKDNNKKTFTTSEVILLVIMSLLIGLSASLLLSKTSVITKNQIIDDAYLKEFVDNYEYIVNNYYEEVDKSKLIDKAIKGMTESLDDPYSTYFNENESDNFSITLNGSYKGVGIQIGKEENGYMLITAVFKNSPAEEAGLKAGDEVISIDGKSVVELTTKEFSDLVKNGDNKQFSLKVLRDEKEIDITLKRSTVTLDSVASEMYERNGKKIGYIYIGIFANNTCDQFKQKLDALEKEKIDYLIIDVRQNTGGHLTSVDGILDIFLNSKQVMYKFEQNKKVTSIYGTGKENKKYEIVLLGDNSSASASEVLIAGLKENLNSKLIGKQTYGKGTVQEMVNLSDGTQYKITVKKWLTPKGNWINDTKGIKPDIDVDLSDKYYETGEIQDDTQLQAAFDYIEGKWLYWWLQI